jgi:hypothetical protein
MIKKPVFAYYDLGRTVQFLRDAHPTWSVHGEGYIFDCMKDLKLSLENLGLKYSQRIYKSHIGSLMEDLEKTPPKGTLDKNYESLRSLLNVLETGILAEIPDRFVFELRDKIFSLDDLLNKPDKILGITSWETFDSLAKYDIQEACNCYAFERYTASAFHLMRTIERLLRCFYIKQVKTKRIPEPWNMGNIIQHMESKPNLIKKYDSIISQLKSIKNNYRNPTQHPEKVYQPDELENLWHVCIDVINRLTKEL